MKTRAADTVEAAAFVCVPDTTGSSEICSNGLDDDCDGESDEADDCALCIPAETTTLPTQTKKTKIKLSDSPARDKVSSQGAFVMSDPESSSPDSEDVTVLVTDESGDYYIVTIPAGSFESKTGGKKYLYKDKSKPYELGGVKSAKFQRGRDGITMKYKINAKELDQAAFNGTASTVTVKIGSSCYADGGDLCTISGSGKTTQCR